MTISKKTGISELPKFLVWKNIGRNHWCLNPTHKNLPQKKTLKHSFLYPGGRWQKVITFPTRNQQKRFHDSASNAVLWSTENFWKGFMILLQMLCLDPQQISIFYSTSCTQVCIFEDQNEDIICPCDSVTTRQSIFSKWSISGYFQQCIYPFAQNNWSNAIPEGNKREGEESDREPTLSSAKDCTAFGFRQRITPTSTKFFPPSRSHNKYHHMV